MQTETFSIDTKPPFSYASICPSLKRDGSMAVIYRNRSRIPGSHVQGSLSISSLSADLGIFELNRNA
ncbi:MAG: hypothetical protein B1H11_03405 [Desulfobacteraceae bacterium 4484_190.1]|nr:MAG: hypothetical protein B1H11_03405 [Desulfobacteraceae bacterium 4484_190.1]